MDGWLVVRNWARFQHYSKRNPPWIKVYTELNSVDEWRHLTMAERGLMITIWLEYARSNGQLRAQTILQMCTQTPGQRYGRRHLESLNHAGFIDFRASKPLALVEKRREEKKKDRASARTPKTINGEPRSNAAAYRLYNDPPLTDAELELIDDA